MATCDVCLPCLGVSVDSGRNGRLVRRPASPFPLDRHRQLQSARTSTTHPQSTPACVTPFSLPTPAPPPASSLLLLCWPPAPASLGIAPAPSNPTRPPLREKRRALPLPCAAREALCLLSAIAEAPRSCCPAREPQHSPARHGHAASTQRPPHLRNHASYVLPILN